jgi:hypothetical protein
MSANRRPTLSSQEVHRAADHRVHAAPDPVDHAEPDGEHQGRHDLHGDDERRRPKNDPITDALQLNSKYTNTSTTLSNAPYTQTSPKVFHG